jgi:hypothetical protein
MIGSSSSLSLLLLEIVVNGIITIFATIADASKIIDIVSGIFNQVLQ